MHPSQSNQSDLHISFTFLNYGKCETTKVEGCIMNLHIPITPSVEYYGFVLSVTPPTDLQLPRPPRCLDYFEADPRHRKIYFKTCIMKLS